VGGVVATYPPPTSWFHNQCKDDSALFARFLYGIHVQNQIDSFWIRKIKHIRKFSYKEEQLIYTVKYNDDLVRSSCYASSILQPFHLFGDFSNAAINLFKVALPNLAPVKG
jgi:hypothetical protein